MSQRYLPHTLDHYVLLNLVLCSDTPRYTFLAAAPPTQDAVRFWFTYSIFLSNLISPTTGLRAAGQGVLVRTKCRASDA